MCWGFNCGSKPNANQSLWNLFPLTFKLKVSLIHIFLCNNKVLMCHGLDIVLYLCACVLSEVVWRGWPWLFWLAGADDSHTPAAHLLQSAPVWEPRSSCCQVILSIRRSTWSAGSHQSLFCFFAGRLTLLPFHLTGEQTLSRPSSGRHCDPAPLTPASSNI